jgi:ribosome biogenesis protein MAK21
MPDTKTKPKGKGKNKLFSIEPNHHWYTLVDELDVSARPDKPPTASQVSELFARSEALHTDALKAHSDVGTDTSTSDGTFLQKVLQGGTLSDRLSALTLLVQGSPLHNVKSLDTLKGLAERGKGKGGRDESLKAVRAISDWWVGGGAPARKLKSVLSWQYIGTLDSSLASRYFRDQPLLHPHVTDRHLVVWYFEDWLKKYFFSLLQILEVCVSARVGLGRSLTAQDRASPSIRCLTCECSRSPSSTHFLRSARSKSITFCGSSSISS